MTSCRRKAQGLRSIVGLVAFLGVCGVAQAQVYKCTDAKGRITYQAAPCPQGASAAAVGIRTAPAPAAAGGAPEAAPAPDTVETLRRQADTAAKVRRLQAIERQLRSADARIGTLQARMGDEMERLRQAKRRAYNNLAGATLEQSLSTEMQAVASRYDAMIRAEQDMIARLRADQAALQAQP